jgi:hypothetical protein
VGDGGGLVYEMAGIAILCEELEALLQNLEDEQEVADGSYRSVDPNSLTFMDLLTSAWVGIDIFGASSRPEQKATGATGEALGASVL